MTKLDFIFQTEALYDGYKIGINIELKNDLSSDKYNELYSKISFIFRTFSYGMNIEKITKTIKMILLDAKEKTYSVVISVLNSKDKDRPNNITNVTDGRLADDIYNSSQYRSKEFYYVKYMYEELNTYYHNDVNDINNLSNKFVYRNGKTEFEYNDESFNQQKRNASLNMFFKHNLETLKKLENIKVEELKPEINVNDSILVTAYKTFYNELPDFNDPDMVTKMQCMAAIMHVNVMSIIPCNTEHNYNDKNILAPESQYIKDQLLKLYLLLGNDLSNIETYKFKAAIIEKIKIFGAVIRNHLKTVPENERMNLLKEYAINHLNSPFILDEYELANHNLMRVLAKKDPKN